MAARRSLALFGAGLLLVTGLAGAFPTTAGAVTTVGTQRLWGPNTQYAGSADAAQRILALARFGSTVFVGGSFAEIRPEPGAGVPAVARPNLYAVDAVTGAYRPGFAAQVNGAVEALEIDPQTGTLFVGGRFTQVNGQDVPGLAVLDAATGQLSPIQRAVRNGGAGGQVLGLKRVGRQLYVGGNFGSIGGLNRGNLARLDLDAGLAVSAFQVYLSGLVRAMDVDPANPGRIYVGGEFSGARTTADGVNLPGTQWLAAFSTADTGAPPGRLDTAFLPNVPCADTCTNPTRGRTIIARNGLVYAGHGGGGGRLMIYRQADARVEKNLSLDGDVQALALIGDRLVVGGHFVKINNPSLARCHLFSIQSTGRFDVLPEPIFANGAHLGVFAISPDADGGALIGGNITSPSDGTGIPCNTGNSTAPYNYLVHLTPGPVPADVTAPTVPGGLRAGSAAFTAMNLSWGPSADDTGISAYYVLIDGVRRASVAGGQTSALVTGLAANRSYQVAVQSLDSYGNRSAVSAPIVVTTGPAPPGLPSPLRAFGQFFPTGSPARLLDTRSGIGGPAAPVAAGAPRSLTVVGAGGVPAGGVQLVALNVTVTAPSQSGYLTVFPGGGAQPPTSSLNFRAGQTVANMVVARVGVGGTVQFAVSAGATQVLVDVVGWFASNEVTQPGARLVPQAPERILDTRNGMGRTGTAMVGPGETVELAVGPPGQDRGVVVNLTGVTPTAATYVTVFPGGAGAPPNASNLNLVPGDVRPNLVMVGVSAAGTIKLFNASGSVHLIVDVVARFRATSSLDNNPAGRLLALDAPIRMADTRTEAGGPQGPGARTVDFGAVEGSMPGGIAVQGLVLNATATQATAPTYLSLYPSGTPVPNASNLNVVPGDDVPNLAVVRLSGDERLDIFNAFGAVHELLDVTALVLG